MKCLRCGADMVKISFTTGLYQYHCAKCGIEVSGEYIDEITRLCSIVEPLKALLDMCGNVTLSTERGSVFCCTNDDETGYNETIVAAQFAIEQKAREG